MLRPGGRAPIRSLARSAWESVPPMNRPPFDALSLAQGGRRVRYDREHLIPEVYLVEMRRPKAFSNIRDSGPKHLPSYSKFRHSIIESARTPAQIKPYPTPALSKRQRVEWGTDLLGWLCPRHFVPGYDRTVPPGHLGSILHLDQPFSEPGDRGVCATEGAQFLHDVIHVTFHRAFADPQCIRNFLVRSSRCDTSQH
jgi:hypothetical protein